MGEKPRNLRNCLIFELINRHQKTKQKLKKLIFSHKLMWCRPLWCPRKLQRWSRWIHVFLHGWLFLECRFHMWSWCRWVINNLEFKISKYSSNVKYKKHNHHLFKSSITLNPHQNPLKPCYSESADRHWEVICRARSFGKIEKYCWKLTMPK